MVDAYRGGELARTKEKMVRRTQTVGGDTGIPPTPFLSLKINCAETKLHKTSHEMFT